VPERKSFALELKAGADETGSFKATIATFNVVDKDGDVTFPGAFPAGKEIPISAYGHQSWYGALPVGKGIIGADEKSAWVEGAFFTDTTPGADTYKTAKNLGPLMEWSYGYDPTDSVGPEDARLAGHAEYAGASRGLVKVTPFEASPVLLGAGVMTGTEWVKSMNSPYSDHAETVLAAVKTWFERSRELAALRKKEGRVLSDANRTRLASLADALDTVLGDVRTLLSETDPNSGKAARELVERIALGLESDGRLTAAGIYRI
jgi:hypothetical protein